MNTIFKKKISIAGRAIGTDFPPYVIAEMSANHNGDIRNALRIIDAAKLSGADAVKIQTYRPDTITLKSNNPEFMINEGLWAGRSLYDLYEEAHLPWEWHGEIFSYARDVGITIFSSPFDSTAIDLLEDLNAPAYKIASFEMIDLPLIKYAASTKKPLIISTGMANDEEITEAVDAASSAGCTELVILHCVSGYPTLSSDYNLRTMQDMGSRFNVMTGLSDHTLDNLTALASVALGAVVIEKHVTLDRSRGGPDDSFSLEPSELEKLCVDSLRAWEALGKVDYGLKPGEKGSLLHRRSLYFVENLAAGDVISSESIKSVRPGNGMLPKFFDDVVGQTLKFSVSYGDPVLEELLYCPPTKRSP
jgi:pseudaminic acid synthase